MRKTSSVLVFILALAWIIPTGLGAQQVYINEVMGSNLTTIADEDGDFPDWMELYNAGTTPVNLSGFHLTDDRGDLTQWTFPALTLTSDSHLLIFASDKDRTEQVTWRTAINWGDNWRWRLGDSEPPSNWNSPEFDDSGWSTGPSGFGYGDDDDATVIDETMSVYIRKSFTVTDPAQVLSAILHVDCDDGFVAYLNGEEIARHNLGAPGSFVPYNQGADTWIEAALYSGGAPMAFPLDSARHLLQSGENVLAFQGHNYSETSSDLTLIPFFSIGYSGDPGTGIVPPDILNLTSANLHTNFKIAAGGEALYLVSPEDSIVDSIPPDSLPTDVSKGRYPDGSNSWLWYTEPSPGAANSSDGFAGVTSPPEFSQTGGFYTNALSLTLSLSNPAATIYYTTDGTAPSASSTEYAAQIPIAETSVIRAKAYAPDMLPSRIVTHTYFLNASHELPVISLVMRPGHLWDADSGIYVLGDTHESAMPYFGANFWEEWERPVHIEMYESDGSKAFSHDAGTRIFGGWSRTRPQKSMAIFFRGEYGTSELEYQLFPDLAIDTFSSFVLRNSGNDWEHTMMRDGFLQGLVSGLDMETQAYRPAVVYLNGEYWGILNIREKMNEEYLASHHNVDPDEVDMLELNGTVIEGNADHYTDMISYIESNGVAVTNHYDYIRTQMDVDNFIDYQITQIYYDNQDWPGNNIKYWRPQTPDGRWRWLLYDTEYGFGIYEPDNYYYNTLEFATVTDGPGWPNPPWSTYLLRSLLENTEFKHQFISRFADLLNTVFKPDTVIAQIDEKQATIESEIQEHIDLWSQEVWWIPQRLWWNDMQTWLDNVDVMRTFALHRATYVRSHIIQYFGLAGTVFVEADVSPLDAGHIQINTMTPAVYPWQGQYFKDIPITVRAIANPGYQFTGWEDHPEWESATVEITPTSSITLQALFEPDENGSDILINEINYNSDDAFDTEDWVELINRSSEPIDISGWAFADENDDHVFTLPENTIMDGGSYIVLCVDTSVFRTHFPDAVPILGNTGFGFSGGGEVLRLFDGAGNLVDSVEYDDDEPWPVAADGDGATLELENPWLDNSDPANWEASENHGTPGAQNSTYIEVETGRESNLPTKFVLHQNYPNPFNAVTSINYEIPRVSDTRMAIFNLRGEEIRMLQEGPLQPGRYAIKWDGRNSEGEMVSSGLYIYCLTTPNSRLTQKMVLMK